MASSQRGTILQCRMEADRAFDPETLVRKISPRRILRPAGALVPWRYTSKGRPALHCRIEEALARLECDGLINTRRNCSRGAMAAIPMQSSSRDNHSHNDAGNRVPG
jgi:hypothetical protein